MQQNAIGSSMGSSTGLSDFNNLNNNNPSLKSASTLSTNESWTLPSMNSSVGSSSQKHQSSGQMGSQMGSQLGSQNQPHHQPGEAELQKVKQLHRIVESKLEELTRISARKNANLSKESTSSHASNPINVDVTALESELVKNLREYSRAIEALVRNEIDTIGR
jgi:hypothetical protein